jgi:nucleotide-binding universal stress UspA family protein
MPERILIPLDGSETAEAVLPQVRRILKRHEGEVVLVQAVPPYPPDFHLIAPGPRPLAEKYLRRVTFQLVNDGVRATGLVRSGAPADVILDVAEEKGISLIAMSTHGRTGLARWVFGSVTEKVLRASAVPLLLIRSFPAPDGRALSRGRLEALPFRTILVPLDGSEESRSVLTAVKALAGPIDAHVTLLTVTEEGEAASRWYSPGLTAESAERDLREACIPVRWEHRRGDPAVEILKTCDEEPVDLIAMSTHGRSGPGRWVLGSVTEKVLRAARLPMLVVRRAKVPAASGGAPSGAVTR